MNLRVRTTIAMVQDYVWTFVVCAFALSIIMAVTDSKILYSIAFIVVMSPLMIAIINGESPPHPSLHMESTLKTPSLHFSAHLAGIVLFADFGEQFVEQLHLHDSVAIVLGSVANSLLLFCFFVLFASRLYRLATGTAGAKLRTSERNLMLLTTLSYAVMRLACLLLAGAKVLPFGILFFVTTMLAMLYYGVLAVHIGHCRTNKSFSE